MRTYTDDEIGAVWIDRCDELERRIVSLERRIGDGAKGYFARFDTHLQKTRDAIEFLESRALRPEDRPPQEDIRARSRRIEERLSEETALRMLGRSLAALEASVEELERKLAGMNAFRDEAMAELKELMPRVDKLEERCLKWEERDHTKLEYRGLFDHIDPMSTVRGVNIGKT